MQNIQYYPDLSYSPKNYWNALRAGVVFSHLFSKTTINPFSINSIAVERVFITQKKNRWCLLTSLLRSCDKSVKNSVVLLQSNISVLVILPYANYSDSYIRVNVFTVLILDVFNCYSSSSL